MPLFNLGWVIGYNYYGWCGISQSLQANSLMVHLSDCNSFFINIPISSVTNDPSFLVFVNWHRCETKTREKKVKNDAGNCMNTNRIIINIYQHMHIREIKFYTLAYTLLHVSTITSLSSWSSKYQRTQNIHPVI